MARRHLSTSAELDLGPELHRVDQRKEQPPRPAGAFGAYRGIAKGIPLGKWSVETGDTVQFDLELDGTGLQTVAQVGIPFLPRNGRGASPPIPTWAPTYSASPATAAAAAATGETVQIEFDEDGIADLTSLQLAATVQPGATVQPDLDGATAIAISSIALPSGDNVVVGQNAKRAPGSIFAAGLRSYSWVNFGAYNVSAGSTIVVTFDNNAAEALDVVAGLRFYPKNGPANRNRCPQVC